MVALSHEFFCFFFTYVVMEADGLVQFNERDRTVFVRGGLVG